MGRFGSFSEVNIHLPEDPVVLSQLFTQEDRTCMSHRLEHELELFTAALFVNTQNTRNPVRVVGRPGLWLDALTRPAHRKHWLLGAVVATSPVWSSSHPTASVCRWGN